MRRSLLIVVATLALACGGRTAGPTDGSGSGNPPGTGPEPSGPIPITGSERIGWDQQISSGDIDDHQFIAFVDGRRTSLPDIQCAGAPGPSGYACSAQLPSMTDGRHTIRLAASRIGGGEVEPVSDKSAELVLIKGPAGITVEAAAGLRIPASDPGAPPVGADDEAIAVEIVATHLAPVNDLAALPDGRLVIGEKNGTVRILSGRATEAASMTVLDGVSQAGGGLLAIAPHPAFSRNHLLYLLYAADTNHGVSYRLARGREVGGRLGEMAVLADLAPAEDGGSGALRFGPDGKLYVALSDLRAAEHGGLSYRGSLLRLEDDGRTPEDSLGASPVVSRGHTRVLGIAAVPQAGAWLVTEFFEGGRVRLLRRHTRTSAPPRPLSLLELGGGAHPGGLIVYSGRAFPRWQGHVFIARLDGQGITTVALNDKARTPATVPNLAGTFGRIRSLAEGRDGSIYFGTANADRTPRAGSDEDRVMRISPRVRGS